MAQKNFLTKCGGSLCAARAICRKEENFLKNPLASPPSIAKVKTKVQGAKAEKAPEIPKKKSIS